MKNLYRKIEMTRDFQEWHGRKGEVEDDEKEVEVEEEQGKMRSRRRKMKSRNRGGVMKDSSEWEGEMMKRSLTRRRWIKEGRKMKVSDSNERRI